MTWAWYSSWLSSSAARSGPSCSAAIQDSAASSTSFLPIVCTPASSACTVPDPSGRLTALSLSSLQSSSNVFIGFSLGVGRGGDKGTAYPDVSPRGCYSDHIG